MQTQDIPVGLCQCGCGEPTNRYTSSWAAKGIVKGEPTRFIRGHQWRTYDHRLHERYRIDEATGCWMWRKTLTPDGYATMRVPKTTHRSMKAHRFYYELLIGPIPKGFELDHLCRNRACVNPAHMEPVTPSENKRRAHRIRRSEGGFSRRVGSVRPYHNGWRVRIKIDGEVFHVGCYATEEDGRQALDVFLRGRGLMT